MRDSTADVHRGLVGVVVDTTTISSVDKDTHTLLYRGFPAEKLAQRFSFEALVHLLWYGALPTQAQLREFVAQERQYRSASAQLWAPLEQLPTSAHPMDVCRCAASLLGVSHPRAGDQSLEATRAKALELFALMPTVVVAWQRRLRGQAPIPPDTELGYVDNFFAMSFGQEPTAAQRHAFHLALVLYAEHSFNASTFTARVITSTESDYHSAVTGAIGALKGPLHGGANEAVIELLLAMQAVGRDIRTWLNDALDKGLKVPGFGHRVYKNGDTRVPPMQAALLPLIAEAGREDLLTLYTELESAMLTAKNLRPNLDYPTAVAYHLIGFDAPLFTPLFTASRIAGWSAHIMEQMTQNILIRPQAHYVGPEQQPLPQ